MANGQKQISRRSFLENSARTAAATGVAVHTLAPASAQPQGANDRIRVGFIGVGNRGSELLERFTEIGAFSPIIQRMASM